MSVFLLHRLANPRTLAALQSASFASTRAMSAQSYEQRAIEAENLVLALTDKVKLLRERAEADRLSVLETENARLRAQVEAAKRELRSKHMAQGQAQIAVPGDAISEEFAEKWAASTGNTKAASAAQAKPVSEKPAPAAASDKKAAKADKKAKAKKEGKKKEDKNAAPANDDLPPISRVDFRVGLITEAKMHPDADALYVETIEAGDAEPRTIISGLAKYVPLEEMQNRLVVICANLKPRKMRGIESQGMVMCASTPEKVVPIAPPAGSKPGDPVVFEGFARNPDAVMNPKKKIYEAVAPDLATNAEGIATFKGIPFVVEGKGPCVGGLANVKVA